MPTEFSDKDFPLSGDAVVFEPTGKSMETIGHGSPRASGRRMSFANISPDVHGWLTSLFGEVEVVDEYGGGMSPGCAASVVTATGHLLFVKAVEDHPGDVTGNLFRHEAHVLQTLPEVDYRPRLLASFDSGGWVALVLDHVEGVYPDLSNVDDLRRVSESLIVQADELSPPPDGLVVPSLQESTMWWVSRWEEIAAYPDRFLPEWAVPMATDGLERTIRLAGLLPDETVCHFDIRNDNLLIQDDGTVTILDWGIAMTGPRWADVVMLALQFPDSNEVDRLLRQWLPGDDMQDLVTDFLVAFGGSQAWDSKLPVPERLPTLRSYLADDAERLLRAAQVRLG